MSSTPSPQICCFVAFPKIRNLFSLELPENDVLNVLLSEKLLECYALIGIIFHHFQVNESKNSRGTSKFSKIPSPIYIAYKSLEFIDPPPSHLLHFFADVI